MNRYLLYAVALLTLVALASAAPACDGLAFAAGACYSQAVVAPVVAPVYQQAVTLPVQSYAAPAQAVVLPPQLTITRPAYTLQLQQAQGYAYSAPLAFAAPHRVFAQRQVVAKVQDAPSVNIQQRGLFGRRLSVQVR